MGRMIRKQVYIEPEHEERLKRRAQQWGVTESELIRRGIEHVTRAPRQPVKDEQAWQDFLAFARSRAELPIAGTGGDRGWTREDLYDDRPKYLSR